MENTENKELEFSLATVFKIFKGKLKAIIAVGLVAAILGGALGAVMYFGTKKTYENTLTFHLPITEKTEYSDILPLLGSNIFLQKILIETNEESYKAVDENGNPLLDASGNPIVDENGNPVTVTIRVPKLNFTQQEKEDFKKYTFLKLHAQGTIDELKTYFNDIPFEKDRLSDKATRASTDYSTIANLLNSYLLSNLRETILPNVREIEEDLENARIEKEKARNEYNECIDTYKENQFRQHNAEKAITEYSEALDDLLIPLYEDWKQNPQNAAKLAAAESGIRFAFSKDDFDSDKASASKGKDEIKQPVNFLYINIQMNDKELANTVIKNISAEIQDFIRDYSTPTDANDIIKVNQISTPDIHVINEASLILLLVKNILIFVIIFEALLVIAIIGIYLKKKYLPTTKSDNQNELKDTEEKEKLTEEAE